MSSLDTLKLFAQAIRIDSVRSTTAAGSGHPTSCLSAADAVAVLLGRILRYDYSHPHAQNNDRFILSKGHAVPVYYAALKNLGVITDAELMSLRKIDSDFEGHPTPRFVHNQAATGSLGQGLAVGVGMALYARKHKLSYKTYVMMGDGEIAEGSVWEAASLASHYKLNNMIALVDCNRLGQSDGVAADHDLAQTASRFNAFGWDSVVIDGHDLAQISDAFDHAQNAAKPFMILLKTFKGAGLTCANKLGFHGKPFTQSELSDVISQLGGVVDAKALGDLKYQLPQDELEQDRVHAYLPVHSSEKSLNSIAQSKSYAPRKAFGDALVDMSDDKRIMAVDADVKNSTYTQLLEDVSPDQFIQCYIAEQAMIGVATGLTQRGSIAFSGSFGAFISRAYDQIRMAAIGQVPLRIFGSHAGVSIGEDGPSQMGLEDLSIMRAVPGSIVLYPADGVSAYKLTVLMAQYSAGISYLRTTRAALPTIYSQNDAFVIGGSRVLKQGTADKLVIVAAGITVHEALKAAVILEQKGIGCSVIDAYCVKPLDHKTILDAATRAGKRVLTVEDHYVQGGLGEAVAAALAPHGIAVYIHGIKNVWRSGKPEELLAAAGIDAAGIISCVQDILSKDA